jgi:hypothetical protein
MIILSFYEVLFYAALVAVITIGLLYLMRWLKSNIDYYLARHRQNLHGAKKNMWTRGR